MLYSQKMSLFPQPNANDSLTMNYVDKDNSVALAPNLTSLSACTPTMHPHISNSTSMLSKPPNIPPIPHHTNLSLFSNTLLSNAKYCDTSKPTKPSFPPITICTKIGSLIILDASYNISPVDIPQGTTLYVFRIIQICINILWYSD